MKLVTSPHLRSARVFRERQGGICHLGCDKCRKDDMAGSSNRLTGMGIDFSCATTKSRNGNDLAIYGCGFLLV